MNKVRVNIVAAMDENRGIGKNDKIPWHLRDDLVRLKNLTKDQYVILGRKSYDSMLWYYDKSGKKMPGRKYLVITRDINYKPKREDAIAVHSITEALQFAEGKSEEVFVIGGANIFEQTIAMADKLYLTIVKSNFDCDTFFPDYAAYKKIISEENREGEGLNYRFLELER